MLAQSPDYSITRLRLISALQSRLLFDTWYKLLNVLVAMHIMRSVCGTLGFALNAGFSRPTRRPYLNPGTDSEDSYSVARESRPLRRDIVLQS